MNYRCGESLEKYQFLRNIISPILECYFIIACNLPQLEDNTMKGKNNTILQSLSESNGTITSFLIHLSLQSINHTMLWMCYTSFSSSCHFVFYCKFSWVLLLFCFAESEFIKIVHKQLLDRVERGITTCGTSLIRYKPATCSLI